MGGRDCFSGARTAGWMGVFYYKEADWEELSAAVNGVGGGFLSLYELYCLLVFVKCFFLLLLMSLRAAERLLQRFRSVGADVAKKLVVSIANFQSMIILNACFYLYDTCVVSRCWDVMMGYL